MFRNTIGPLFMETAVFCRLMDQVSDDATALHGLLLGRNGVVRGIATLPHAPLRELAADPGRVVAPLLAEYADQRLYDIGLFMRAPMGEINDQVLGAPLKASYYYVAVGGGNALSFMNAYTLRGAQPFQVALVLF